MEGRNIVGLFGVLGMFVGIIPPLDWFGGVTFGFGLALFIGALLGDG